MPRTGKPAVRHVAAVERAVAVLEALADGELGTNEIARRTGLTREHGIASAGDARRGSGSSSTTPIRAATASGSGWSSSATPRSAGSISAISRAPTCGRSSTATGETATLSVPGERDAITVDFVQSPHSVRSVAQLGRPSIGHATATGKVVLAFAGHALAGGQLQRFTDLTIVDPDVLERELVQVGSAGFAAAIDERELGLAALAAPALGRGGELVAILGVQGPSERFRDEVLAAAAVPLLAAAAALSRSLGLA